MCIDVSVNVLKLKSSSDNHETKSEGSVQGTHTSTYKPGSTWALFQFSLELSYNISDLTSFPSLSVFYILEFLCLR